MNQIINMEVRFFLTSVLCGALILVAYDLIRIFRKVIEHGVVAISIEDILYWTIGAVFVFRMMYRMNNGVIRGFSLIGILLGMILYKYSISEYVVKGISFVLIKIKLLIKKLIHIFTGPYRFLLSKIQTFIKFIGKYTKKYVGNITHFVKKKVHKPIVALKNKESRVKIKKTQHKMEKEKKRRRKTEVTS